MDFYEVYSKMELTLINLCILPYCISQEFSI